MMTFEMKNDYDHPLRVIVEPEAIEYDLQPGQCVEIHVTGSNPAFQSKHFCGGGVQCVAFWPELGQISVFYEGTNIIKLAT